jgi:hypothetical protein
MGITPLLELITGQKGTGSRKVGGLAPELLTQLNRLPPKGSLDRGIEAASFGGYVAQRPFTSHRGVSVLEQRRVCFHDATIKPEAT